MCIDICPSLAIQFINKKLVIDKQKCLYCEICEEACPSLALLAKRIEF